MMLALLAVQLFVSTSLSATCVSESTSNLEWTSSGNKIYLNGEEFKQKGLSWSGFDSSTNIVHGLWSNSYTNLLDWIASKGFNAIRVPFSQHSMDNNPVVSGYLSSGNEVFSGKTALEAMDIIIDAAADRGLLIMLDFHCTNDDGYLEGFGDLNKETAKATWQTLARRYKDKWNIFMVDIFNEPHDVMNYNGGGSYQWADWIQWVEETSELLLAEGVNWLIGVQGTNYDCSLRSGSADNNCFWGENLQGVDPSDSSQGRTVSLSRTNRFVWLPHVYGPDLNSGASGRQYGASVWKDHWGYLCDGSYPANGAACMVGEFGTKYDTATGQDWLNSLVDYLIEIDSRNSWFWCLNPDSHDTGGLLKDDWRTDETLKLEVLARLRPSPSTISSSGGQVCVDGTGGTTDTGSTDNGGTDTGNTGNTDTGSGDCGFVPSTCSSDIAWAVDEGQHDHPEYYENFQSVTGEALGSADSEDIVLYWHCVGYTPSLCMGMQIPCNRECNPSSGSQSGSTVGSSGSITITTKAGSNEWWYAVTVSASSGLTVTKLEMKSSTMSSWEEGVSEWDYYKFTDNGPYTAPLHFRATLSSGQRVEGQNVIRSISTGSSGSMSVSSAFTAADESASTEGLSSGEVAAIVLSIGLLCCMAGALCFVVYRRRNKVIAAGIEDEEVVEEMEKDADWDMTPIGVQDGNAGQSNTGNNEEDVMIDVPVTETKH